VIQLLFETHEMAVDSEAYRVATAILLHGKQELAGSLREQFVARFLEMDELSANDVAQLGSGRLYFAYGSNLSSRQMRRRCPTARVVIPAFLSNWKLEFNVAAPHLAGAAGGIRRSPNDHVVGILHQLSQPTRQGSMRKRMAATNRRASPSSRSKVATTSQHSPTSQTSTDPSPSPIQSI
jgi:hypothetical protein